MNFALFFFLFPVISLCFSLLLLCYFSDLFIFRSFFILLQGDFFRTLPAPDLKITEKKQAPGNFLWYNINCPATAFPVST